MLGDQDRGVVGTGAGSDVAESVFLAHRSFRGFLQGDQSEREGANLVSEVCFKYWRCVNMTYSVAPVDASSTPRSWLLEVRLRLTSAVSALFVARAGRVVEGIESQEWTSLR